VPSSASLAPPIPDHDAGRIVAVTDPAGRTTRFTYDANGQRTGVQEPDGSVHTLAYTPGYQTASYIAPGQIAATTKTYDSAGRLVGTTLADGRHVTSLYAAGRDTGLQYPEASVDVSYADDTTRPATITRTPVARPWCSS